MKNPYFMGCYIGYYHVLKYTEHPIEVTLLPIVTDVRPVQPSNARGPIEVTLLGMVTDVRPEPANVLFSIEVIVLGIVTDVRPLQLANAPVPI